MDHDTYTAIPALNWSGLKHLHTSPLLYKYRQEHPEPDKAAWVIGRAIHCGILEPERFDERYAVYEGPRRGKAWDAWQAEHPGVQSLKPDEATVAEACGAAVRAHHVASETLRGGRVEELLTWTDPESGLACKGRLDYLTPTRLVDLKTTRRAIPMWFLRDCAEFLYHGQLAYYHDGAIAAGAIPPDARLPIVLAVQTCEPYDCAVYEVAEATLGAGRTLYRGLITRLLECQAADWWPGIAPAVLPLELPPWAAGMNPPAEEEVL